MNLSEKEKYTFEIIQKVVNGDITRKEAMFELHKSRQQIYRLINIFHKKMDLFIKIVEKNHVIKKINK